MAEWSKAHDSKSCVPPKAVPWVRIPLSPPFSIFWGVQSSLLKIYALVTERLSKICGIIIFKYSIAKSST